MNLIFALFGIIIVLFGSWRLWRVRVHGWLTRWTLRGFASGVMLVTLPVATLNGYQGAMTFRPQPELIAAEPIAQGITYTRDVRTEPRPLVIHLLRIDLNTPDLRLAVTPPDTDLEHPYEIRALRTSAYLKQSGAVVAVNAGFFSTSNGTLPGVNEPVDIVGLAVADGVQYSDERRGFRPVFFGEDNQVAFNTPTGAYQHAVAGYYWFLRDGVIWEPDRGWHRLYRNMEPRTVIATDAAGDTLFLIVVDGRQPGYSEGVTIPEMAAIAAEYGAYHALNLDGGGSSTMAANTGNIEVLNTPVHRRIPGWERPVGNHIAVYAPPLE